MMEGERDIKTGEGVEMTLMMREGDGGGGLIGRHICVVLRYGYAGLTSYSNLNMLYSFNNSDSEDEDMKGEEHNKCLVIAYLLTFNQ
jgi:hypothetical protein